MRHCLNSTSFPAARLTITPRFGTLPPFLRFLGKVEETRYGLYRPSPELDHYTRSFSFITRVSASRSGV